MRREVLDAWKNCVKRAMSSQLPQFTLSEARVRPAPPGILKFEWQVQPKLWCFVAFRPLDSEAFDVFAGWAGSKKVAVTNVSAFAASAPDERAESYFAPSMNFVPRSGSAHWSFWEPSAHAVDDPSLFVKEYAEHFDRVLDEREAEALVRPAIGLAMEEIVVACLPALKRRAGQ